jgi:cytoskeletal protein RodZ
MKTVGQILNNARQEKRLTLSEVEKATKIRLAHLVALENDEYEKLPSVASAKGFIKNYAEFLGLSPASVLAVFRRDFTQDEQRRIVSQTTLKPIDKPFLFWTPKLTVILAATVFLIIFFGYLGYQYLSLIRPPKLSLSSPLPEEKIEGQAVEVAGKADPDAVVTVNGELVSLSEEGEFRYQLKLIGGQNTIVVEAVSKRGQKTAIARTVYVIE